MSSATSWRSTWSVWWHHSPERSSREPDGRDQRTREREDGEEPVRFDRGGDRGDPRRPHGRRLRRRRPRERGRPGDGGAVRDAGGDQLHGQGGAGAGLPGTDREALRTAGSESDDGEERGAAGDRLHGFDRGG